MSMPQRPETAKKIDRARALSAKGLSVTAIADKMGVSSHTARYYLNGGNKSVKKKKAARAKAIETGTTAATTATTTRTFKDPTLNLVTELLATAALTETQKLSVVKSVLSAK